MTDTNIIKTAELAGAAAVINEASKECWDSNSAAQQAIESAAPLVALREDFKVHDLEKFQPTRRRLRGVYQGSDIDSFATYVQANAEAGATIFVLSDPRLLSARAVLNLGTPLAPGHADNTASIQPKATAAYQALLDINGKALPQKSAAEWLEDWRDHLKFFRGDEQLNPKHAIAAVRTITIEAARKVETDVQDLRETQSTFEQVAASSRDSSNLPNLIYFQVSPYDGFESRTFLLRFAVHPEDKISIKLSVQRLEVHTEEIAKEFADKVREAMAGAGAYPVLLGQYEARN